MGLISALILSMAIAAPQEAHVRYACHVEQYGGNEDVIFFVAQGSQLDYAKQSVVISRNQLPMQERILKFRECHIFNRQNKQLFKSAKANKLLGQMRY